MAQDILLKVNLFFLFLALISAKTYYVTPSSSTPCPEEGVPCFTLSQYANVSSNYFASNTTLILLPGNHRLNLKLTVQNISFLSIALTSYTETATAITCNQSARFIFEWINVVTIRGLALFGCVNNEITRVEEFIVQDCSFDGQGRNGTGLYLVEVSTANIMRSSFSFNTGRIVRLDKFFRPKKRIGGAIIAISSTLGIYNCTFENNTVTGERAAGGAVYAVFSSITIINSALNNNSVTGDSGEGGALSASNYLTVTIINSTLNGNRVTGDQEEGTGGALYAYYHINITIINSTLNNNIVNGEGGALYADNHPNITIINSTLNSNTVSGNQGEGGAVIALNNPNITIINSTLNNNTVDGDYGAGGALCANDHPSITVINSTFNSNTVTGGGGIGGALYINDFGHITIINSTLKNNIVTGDGGALSAIDDSTVIVVNCTLNNNTGNKGVFYAVKSMLHISGNTTFSNNNGSLFVYFCNMTLMGHISIASNSYISNTSEEGGAITAFQSEIVFTGTVNLVYNRAIQGGGIKAIESKLHNYGDIIISHNTASESGGGIYSHQSEFSFKNNINISRNTATSTGGGIHASSSTIRLTSGSKTNLVGNHAERGGGMYLQGTARVYLTKNKTECSGLSFFNHVCTSWISLYLGNNSANFGGAVYVDDKTSSTACNATPKAASFLYECFLQGLRLYEGDVQFWSFIKEMLNTHNTQFSDNIAKEAGDALYGGLLDRCRANPYSEILFLNQGSQTLASQSLDGAKYLVNITNLKLQDLKSTKTISSDPVRICFCQDNQPDCSYHPQPKYVKRGERFTVSLVAVDQINNTKPNSKIHADVSTGAGLGEGQSIQITNDKCTDLTYSILSPSSIQNLLVDLHLYADGPCMEVGISKATLTVNIEGCPIGFANTDSHCQCDPLIYPEYISNCSIDRETVQRKDNVWFTYENTTHHIGYMLHKHCPFDYCWPPTENISVNLNTENGANQLCAFNRSGKLCGSCEDGLSLSLGSSRCTQCSNNWLALVIVFVLAGIALVVFLLKLNFTVAEGTLNGLILYANIFAANRAIFFPHDKTKLLTVFIAWLNLDFGFETCFYDGMDGYTKTWLQLAFPLYVISLVVAIIIVSDYSSKFARLFYGRNTLPTLATLILLSYTKLLRTIIASLSFTTLQYSDGSYELVWLVDANIPYLSEKHIPLFITAIIIVIIGVAYTFILFAWQWLVYCPNRGPLRWIIGNTKVISIMDAYHHPYNKDHRYWIGLLLVVRVVLYLVSALNVLGDPRINLCSITSTTVIVLSFKHVVESKRKVLKNGQSFRNTSDLQLTRIIENILSRKVHKGQYKEILEISFLLNLAGLSIVTFITDNKDSQNIAAYISAGIAFATFLAILGYHVYKFVVVELFHKKELKNYHPRRAQRQPQVELYSPVALDGEPVWGSMTEVEAPVAIDTISYTEDEQLLIQEDDNIEQDEINTYGCSSEPINQSCSSALICDRPKSPLVTLSSHSKPFKEQSHQVNGGKSGEFSIIVTNPHPHMYTQALNTSIGIEMSNMVSGHSVVAKTSLLEDDSLSEDESTPLLPQEQQ